MNHLYYGDSLDVRVTALSKPTDAGNPSFLEFRLCRDGKLADRFLAFAPPRSYTPEELSRGLALCARFLRDTVPQQMGE